MFSKKNILIVVLVSMMLLTSCNSKVTSTAPNGGGEETPVLSQTGVSLEDILPTEPLPLVDDSGKMVCEVSGGLFPELTAEQEEILAVFAPISETDWSKGSDDPILTVVEYSEFQCPYCSAFYYTLEQLVEAYPEDVRIVFRHFPLNSIHDKAQLASQAVEAAGLQGMFWEMYDVLFQENQNWSGMSVGDFTNWLEEKAGEMGLDASQFMEDLNNEAIIKKVEEAIDTAMDIGLGGVPFVLLNGRPWESARDFATLSAVLKMIKYEKNLYTECPPWVIDTEKTYTATIETEKGDIELELYADKAPLTVNSFVFLAQEGYFDGVTFHRVIKDFMAQTGDPSGTGMSGPGYSFRNEINSDLMFDSAGVLAMANAGPDTNGSQFFITYGEQPALDGNYTIFGKVISGMDVLESITERDTSQDPNLPDGDMIVKITIEEK